MPTTLAPSIEQLKRAIELTQQIEKLQGELNSIFPGSGSKAAVTPAVGVKAEVSSGKKRRKMSAAGRAAIIAAQKARWAKVKGAKGAPAKAAEVAKPKVKRKISAAARARMVAGAKKRWAALKAAAASK